MAVIVTRSAGMLVLGAYLIVVALISMSALAIPSAVPGVLALIAGILILIGR